MAIFCKKKSQVFVNFLIFKWQFSGLSGWLIIKDKVNQKKISKFIYCTLNLVLFQLFS